MANKLERILNDTEYRLSIFPTSDIKELEDSIIEKGKKLYVKCIIREKEVLLKPEEVVRQLYAKKLIQGYKYPKNAYALSIQFILEEKLNLLIL